MTVRAKKGQCVTIEGADPAAFCGGWKKNDTGGRGTTDRRSGVLYAGNDGGAEIPYAARSGEDWERMREDFRG